MESITPKPKVKLKQKKKKIRNSRPGCLAQWYLTQRNIILTSLIILTDVLFLSQKKRTFSFPIICAS